MQRRFKTAVYTEENVSIVTQATSPQIQFLLADTKCRGRHLKGGAAEQVPGLLPGAGQDPLQRPQAADPAGQVRPRLQGARHIHAGPRLGTHSSCHLELEFCVIQH